MAASTWLNEYRSDGPGLAQVVRAERERRIREETTAEVAYFITSLSRAVAGPDRLGALIRARWGVENRLHHVRDVTLGEDACRVRAGNAPEVLAGLRNVVVHLLGGVAAPSKAAATRRFAAHPDEAVAPILT